MGRAVGAIDREVRLTLVEHLDELRGRLIVSLIVFVACFAVCLWQNHTLLHLVNAPLAHQTQSQARQGTGPLGVAYHAQQGARGEAVDLSKALQALAASGSGLSSPARAVITQAERELHANIHALSAPAPGVRPVTLGIGEPFTTTIGVSALFALILALPFVLYELYGFLLPALSLRQKRAVRPLMAAVPVLFAGGVLFGYEVVLPSALHFLQNFNSEQFSIMVQASQYYHFVAMVLIAMGLIFQVPVVVLAANRAGALSARMLRRNRRHALLAAGLVAALLPGDLVTMALEITPLYLLFELSVLIARAAERFDARSRPASDAASAPIGDHA